MQTIYCISGFQYVNISQIQYIFMIVLLTFKLTNPYLFSLCLSLECLFNGMEVISTSWKDLQLREYINNNHLHYILYFQCLRNTSSTTPHIASPLHFTQGGAILTPTERQFYEDNGFIVVKGLVSKDELDIYA